MKPNSRSSDVQIIIKTHLTSDTFTLTPELASRLKNYARINAKTVPQMLQLAIEFALCNADSAPVMFSPNQDKITEELMHGLAEKRRQSAHKMIEGWPA